MNKFFNRDFHPAQVLVVSFLFTIIVGTILLELPGMVVGEPLHVVDALFTSTSAVCVTGLIVVDTATRFTPLGQTVILLLLQTGGLGIMTFSVIFAMMAGKRISFRERVMIQDSFAHSPVKDMKSLVLSILKFTFLVEMAGALLLFFAWKDDFPLGFALFTSLFHSISAFCNAGFSLFSDSLMAYRGNLMVNLTVSVLIILGGLGFLVLMDVEYFLFSREEKRRQLSLHSKTVLSTTAFLLILGTILIFFMEKNNTLSEMSFLDALTASFFQSVTARTAGFNTIDFSVMMPAALFLVIILMFIGASPGSTGGGVKTTTLGVLMALIKSRYSGREEVSLFRRTIPEDVVARSLMILVSAVMVVIIFVMILLVTESGELAHTERRGQFVVILFESVSAFGTVGLSTGVTSSLSVVGKLVITVLMFTGRLGPLTIALAVGKKYARGKFQYSEERVMTG